MAKPFLDRLELNDFFKWIKSMYKSHPLGLQAPYAKTVAEVAELILREEQKGFKKIANGITLEHGYLLVVISALAHDIYGNPHLKNVVQAFRYQSSYRSMLRSNLKKRLGETDAVDSIIAIVDYVNELDCRELTPAEAFLAGIVLDSKKIYILYNYAIPACQAILDEWSDKGAQGFNDRIHGNFAREFIMDAIHRME